MTIDGWTLSDSLHGANAYVMPAGSGAVPPGETRIVPATALPFSLDALRGGDVYISHSGTHRGRRTYGAWDGHAWGLVKRAAGDAFVRVHATPPTPGNVPVVGPVVVSQINYHPPDMPGDDAAYEFVEWMNTGTEPLDVGEWRLAGDASLTVPVGTVLPAGARLVLAAVSPADFAARYDVADGTLVFGPWSGGLPNSSGQVRLVRRLPAVTGQGPDFGYRPEVVLEEIQYIDGSPWPAEADGDGPALVRAVPDGFAGDAHHWTAVAPAPGRAPTPNLPPTASIVSPAHGEILPLGQPIEVAVAASDPDGGIRQLVLEVDGSIAEGLTQPPYRFSWTPPGAGTYWLGVRAIDGRLASAGDLVAVVVTNQPPLVALLQPASGARVHENASVTMQAAAFDPEGQLDRVEFLVDGEVIGALTSPPWRMTWNAGPAGHRSVTVRASDSSGLTRSSSPAAVFVTGASAAAPVIAYRVPAGITGNQAYSGSLGHDFEVRLPILVTRLGVFDSGGNGLSSTITAQIWRHADPPQRLANLTFSPASPGELAPGTSSRFKPLDEPLVLGPGIYSVTASGYSAAEQNGNSSGDPPAWSTSSGGGLIRFIGTARYGAAAQFPATLDTGPVDRYAGPTFEFVTADADGDFMPADWELAHGFDPDDPADGAADADGDGMSNQDEYAAGTDPRQASSRLALELLAASPTHTTVRFTLPAHRSATIQSSHDLLFWIDRQSIPVAATERTLEFTLPTSPPEFLRLAVRP